ncbi:hypothetical protein ACRAWD_23840 [Caulobacter segnis]
MFKLDGQTLKLAVTGGPLKGADMAGAYFFPYSPKVIETRGRPGRRSRARGPDPGAEAGLRLRRRRDASR